ncbi:MAG TPA: hypothetical protein VGJ86_09690, partial [Acidimicrobiales bacterium]
MFCAHDVQGTRGGCSLTTAVIHRGERTLVASQPTLPTRTVAKVIEQIIVLSKPGTGRRVGVSRQELHEATNLSLGTITRAVNPLIGRLLSEVSEITEARRTRKLLKIIPDAATIAGISITSGTDPSTCELIAVTMDLAGTQLSDPTSLYLTATDPPTVLDGILKVVREIQLHHNIDAVGVELGGHVRQIQTDPTNTTNPIKTEKGVVLCSPNLG